MANASDDEHEAMWRWNVGAFDPSGFDLNAANRPSREWLSRNGRRWAG